ncbi:MAG: tetratricopeptide repeat protein [Sphingobacteriales bacterium]
MFFKKIVAFIIALLITCHSYSQSDSNDINSLYLKGITLSSTRHYNEAILLFDTILMLQPSHRDARMARAHNYFLLSNYKPAREDLNYLLDENKKDTQALYNRMLLFLAMREYGLAVRDIKHYIDLKPNDPEGWYYKGHIQKDALLYNDALDNLDKAIELAGGSHYKSFVVKGNIYTIKNKKDKAIEQYELAMKADSTQGLPYLNRAKIFLTRKDTTAAMKDLDKALAINPEDEYTISLVNTLFIKLGSIEKANQLFDSWIQKDSASINGWMGKGYLQVYKENYTEARESFSKVLYLNPDYAEALFFHGAMLIETGDKKAGREEIRRAADLGYTPAKQYLTRTWKMIGNILMHLMAATTY